MNWIIFWSDRPYPPHLMTLVARATVFGFKKVFSQSRITTGGNYWHKAENFYLYPEKELNKTSNSISQKAIQSPEFIFNAFKISFNYANELRKFTERYLSTDISKKSSKDLVGFIEKFNQKFIKMYSYATLAPLLGYRENPLYQKMNEILKAETKNIPEKFAEYLVVLTNPPKVLKTQEQELKILLLAKKVKKRKIKSSKEIMSRFKKELDIIRKEFSWLSFDICNSIGWNKQYYAKLVSEKLNFNINQKIKELNNYERTTDKNYKKLINKIHLTVQEQKTFQLIRNLGYYKWARQYEFQKALYLLKFVQDELGRRFGLTQLESKYLLPEEYRQLIANSKKLKIKTRKRLKDFLVICSRNKKQIILEGQQAKKYFSHLDFVKEKVATKKKELKGMPAFPGKGTGTVKIINKKRDLVKMKKGNILVSVATSPDLLSAMKKASAIVTNEGGITCHAAIVSRELKIPCVVGTKIATRILKDNDKIEVDAERGVVRKI